MTMTTWTFNGWNDLEAKFRVLHQMNQLQVRVVFDLAAYMTRKRVTIKALAAQMGVSQDRVRQVRDQKVQPFLVAWDFALGVLTVSLHRGIGR